MKCLEKLVLNIGLPSVNHTWTLTSLHIRPREGLKMQWHVFSTITTYLKYSNDTAVLALLNDNNSVMGYHNSISHCFIRYAIT